MDTISRPVVALFFAMFIAAVTAVPVEKPDAAEAPAEAVTAPAEQAPPSPR